MAKLIGHYFSAKAGDFSTFELGPLKETEKQYKKTKETIDGAPRFSYDYWNVLPKSELGQLRKPDSGCFTMYALEPDMAGFQALVVERLEQAAESARQRYGAALSLLESARTLVPKEPGAGIDEESLRPFSAVPANEKTEKPSVLKQLRNGNPPGERQEGQHHKRTAASRE